MIKIRKGTFETNSSSTHTLIICTDEEYKNAKNLYMDMVSERVFTREEYIDYMSNLDFIGDYEDDLECLGLEGKHFKFFTEDDWLNWFEWGNSSEYTKVMCLYNFIQNADRENCRIINNQKTHAIVSEFYC